MGPDDDTEVSTEPLVVRDSFRNPTIDWAAWGHPERAPKPDGEDPAG